jgi:hypothetical protein
MLDSFGGISMNTLRIMAFVFGLLILWVRCGAQVRSADSQLAELDKRLQQAVVDGRADLLEHFLAEDFTFTHGEDTKDTKAVWVARARQVPRHYLRRDVSSQVVEIHGDVGLVFGRLDTADFRHRQIQLLRRPAALPWSMFTHMRSEAANGSFFRIGRLASLRNRIRAHNLSIASCLIKRCSRQAARDVGSNPTQAGDAFLLIRRAVPADFNFVEK